MTTQNEVTALCQTHELLIGILGDLPSKVGDTDDKITFLLLAKDVNVLLCRLSRIEESEAFAVAVEHKSLQGRCQANSPIFTPSRLIVT